MNNYNNNYNKNHHNNPTIFNFNTRNMNYIYNCAFYDEMKKEGANEESISKAVVDFRFKEYDDRYLEKIESRYFFELKTSNPGLLIGSGNFGFSVEEKESFKLGFSFDYVTGLPYIPGSSIKGAIRNYFPKDEKDKDKIAFIRTLIGKDIDVLKYIDIFDNDIVFLDAYPKESGKLLSDDYITPHEEIKRNPTPIRFIKVKPGVTFVFNFIIKNNNVATELCDIFKAIIINMGLGAKTNVGYGRFEKCK